MSNEEKIGKWLAYVPEDPATPPWFTSPLIATKLVAVYGVGELDHYRLATEEEVHAEIERRRADPAVWKIEACPCGKHAAFDRAKEGAAR